MVLLGFRRLSLRRLYNNVFSKLPSLKTLVLKRLADGLEAVRPYAFNSTTLTKLIFSTSDRFTFQNSKNFVPSFVFKNCKNLCYLDISENIMQLDSKDIIQMFSPLKNVKILKMKKMKITRVPEYVFQLFPKLSKLYLDGNKIDTWNNDIPFRNMPSLKFLSLTFNRIAILNKTSFPNNFLNGSLRSMALFGNPFSCTYELKWFRNWMKSTPIKLLEAHEFTCAVSKQLVVDYNPTYEQCSPKILVTVIIGIISSVVFSSIAFAVIIYKCRWVIRYQLYKIRNRKDQEHMSLLHEDKYMYDFYVIYSDKDFKWIKDYLIPNIEMRHGHLLCLRDRDFLPGNIFVDDMCTKMGKSKIILTILSNNFAKDPWCRFQLAIAREISVEFNKVCIIPILLHEIDYRVLNETVYHFISHVNYHSWNPHLAAQELFWMEILSFLK